jgi:sugar phosphate isomerase/epimerase
MNHVPAFSRRQFLQTTATTASALALAGALPASLRAAETFAPPIVLFDKVLHQVKLTLEDSAALVEEVGLDGVDCAVRPNDQIEPERVKDDLPRYARLLRKRNRKVMLLTTAILNPASPHARDVLDTARKLGVTTYRLAFTKWEKGQPVERQLADVKLQLREIVALDKELGVRAMLQNHSPGAPGGYLGGDLNHMRELVQDFPPAQLGVAFDLGHALIVHGDG